MLSAILMGLGAAVWLIGELAAVLSHGRTGEPTTWYVRTFQRRWPVFRVAIITLLVWLMLHFEAGVP